MAQSQALRPAEPPLNWKQAKKVYLLIGLALALMYNRYQLPVWMLPEYRVSGKMGAETEAFIQESNAMRERVGWPTAHAQIHVNGRDVLFLGDSMVRNTPPALADVVSLHGAAVHEMKNFLTAKLADRHYHTIVLWPGTAHLRAGNQSVFMDEVSDLVRAAKAQSDHVVLITPMPWYRVPAFRWTEYVRPILPSWVKLAEWELSRRLDDPVFKDVQIYNAGEFKSEAILDGTFPRYFEDTVHPTARGIERIYAEVDAYSGGQLTLPRVLDRWVYGPAGRPKAVAAAPVAPINASSPGGRSAPSV